MRAFTLLLTLAILFFTIGAEARATFDLEKRKKLGLYDTIGGLLGENTRPSSKDRTRQPNGNTNTNTKGGHS